MLAEASVAPNSLRMELTLCLSFEIDRSRLLTSSMRLVRVLIQFEVHRSLWEVCFFFRGKFQGPYGLDSQGQSFHGDFLAPGFIMGVAPWSGDISSLWVLRQLSFFFSPFKFYSLSSFTPVTLSPHLSTHARTKK